MKEEKSGKSEEKSDKKKDEKKDEKKEVVVKWMQMEFREELQYCL